MTQDLRKVQLDIAQMEDVVKGLSMSFDVLVFVAMLRDTVVLGEKQTQKTDFFGGETNAFHYEENRV